MPAKGEELKGLWVSVDRVEYIPGAAGPPDRPHQFVYYITIHNDSPKAVTIVGRKWVVTNDAGHRLVIEGDGVVGQFPRLTPGEQFHYNSYHLVDTDSEAEGAYLAKDEQGNGLVVRIPSFRLDIPVA
ncbi:MAG: ApaG domain [Verrucomicrobia bacterium]|jgi:ApaG protein|nr:ApaG domain [Verrucomicrobiota bacterium]